jgi:hypothetical protein
MGEIMPFLVIALIVLGALVAVMANNTRRKAVVQPLEEQDLVKRVKIRLSRVDALRMVTSIQSILQRDPKKGPYIFEHYETDSGRLIHLEIDVADDHVDNRTMTAGQS